MPIERDDEVVLLQGSVMVSIVTTVEMAVEVAFFHCLTYGTPVFQFSPAFIVCHMMKIEAKYTFPIVRPTRCCMFQALNSTENPQSRDPNAIYPHLDKSDNIQLYARLTECLFVCLRRECG